MIDIRKTIKFAMDPAMRAHAEQEKLNPPTLKERVAEVPHDVKMAFQKTQSEVVVAAIKGVLGGLYVADKAVRHVQKATRKPKGLEL